MTRARLPLACRTCFRRATRQTRAKLLGAAVVPVQYYCGQCAPPESFPMQAPSAPLWM